MANIVFNVQLGAWAERIRDGDGIQVIPVLTAGLEADSALRDSVSVTEVFDGATDEATTGGWNRKTIANGSITLTIDHTNDRVVADIADQVWTAVTTGAISKLLFTLDGGADGSRNPICLNDFAITPDGSDVTAQVSDFVRAASAA